MIGDFKNSIKYAVERGFDGDRVVLTHVNGTYSSSPRSSQDLPKIPRLCSKDFTVEAWYAGGKVFVSDVLEFDGEDVRGEPWNKRYLILKNEFEWSRPVYMSKHLVVQGRKDFRVALELYNSLPHSEGAVVKPYHSKYDSDETYFVPEGEI